MNALYTGTAFYAGNPPLIPLLAQLEAFQRGMVTESAHQWKRRMGEAAANVPPLMLTNALVKRLKSTGISVRQYDKYRVALHKGEMTIIEMAKEFREKRKDVSAQVATLAEAEFVKVCGYDRDDIIWAWKG